MARRFSRSLGLIVPVLGGLLASAFGWRVSFAMGALAALIGVVAILLFTRATTAARAVGLRRACHDTATLGRSATGRRDPACLVHRDLCRVLRPQRPAERGRAGDGHRPARARTLSHRPVVQHDERDRDWRGPARRTIGRSLRPRTLACASAGALVAEPGRVARRAGPAELHRRRAPAGRRVPRVSDPDDLDGRLAAASTASARHRRVPRGCRCRNPHRAGGDGYRAAVGRLRWLPRW